MSGGLPCDVIRDIEAATFRAWPDLASERLDGWLLRFAESYTKRANSVNVLEPRDDGLEERIAEAEHRYRIRGLAPVFRLTPLAEPGLDRALADRGYAPVDASLVMIAPMIGGPTRHGDVVVVEDDAPGWRRSQAVAAGLSEGHEDTQRRMLARMTGRVAFAMADNGRGPCAFGIAVVDGDRVGFFDILTVPMARRRGWARRLVESLIAWARDEAGATSMWIQVVADNAPACALYGELGFRALYPYHYRIAPLTLPSRAGGDTLE